MNSLSLAGAWTLRDAAGGAAIPCAIPGDVYSALLAAKRIPDPYYGRNELAVQGPGEQDWILERSIAVSADQLARSEAWLTIEGLDTVAEISLNGAVIGNADNQFRRWRFEVRQHLKAGDNRIAVRLRSAVREAEARAKRLPYPIPWSTNNQVAHMNMLRKTQCHAGWDWGICLVTAGIYHRIDLTFVDAVRLDYVLTTQRHEAGRCTVSVSAEVRSPAGGEVPFTVELAGRTVERRVRLGAGTSTVTAEVVVENPKLWWPNGHGAQPLYDLRVAVGDQVIAKKIGLRTIELINQPDERGISMTFRVNGRDIFCKGANWIPADAMPSRETEERFRDLLDSAADAHMNMIRVWGGGQFERDRFYELCDEKGLLLWHDMMFSCALYPADRDFLANVREEVLHQIKRLRDHACIALWCGDNECIGALGWYPESKATRERFVINWARLNQTLADAIAEADPSRVFWPSSPCSGPGDFSDGWHDDTKGDMHYWDVWHGGKGMEAYFSIKPRFCSEFGYQSFTTADLAKTLFPPDHR
jgi:beta-mannosidase